MRPPDTTADQQVRDVLQRLTQAITISTRTQQATYQGNLAPGGQFRVTHIMVRRGGSWLVAGFHVSPVSARPGR